MNGRKLSFTPCASAGALRRARSALSAVDVALLDEREVRRRVLRLRHLLRDLAAHARRTGRAPRAGRGRCAPARPRARGGGARARRRGRGARRGAAPEPLDVLPS